MEFKEEYIYYIKSIVIFVIMYFIYKRYNKLYILLGLLLTIPLFLMYEMSDLPLSLPTAWLSPLAWLCPLRGINEYQLWPSDRGWI